MKNFEACPRRHLEVDLKKSVQEGESEQLTWGNSVHKSLARRVGYGEKLPIGMEMYEIVCAEDRSSKGKILVEQQLAINKDFGPTAWFAPNVWFRAKIDVAVVTEPVALLGDYKTGKIIEDSVQLTLAAATFFAHAPTVQKIRSKFYWLGDGVETPVDVARGDMPKFWASIWPRVERSRSPTTPTIIHPSPVGYCRRWCPVKSCEYWGNDQWRRTALERRYPMQG